jgi:hypothetical protein
MSYVTALPAMLASAAGELQSIGSYPPDFRPTDTRPPDTSRPSYTCRRWGARVGQRLTGRGLVFSCSFCATSSLSAGRIPRSRR